MIEQMGIEASEALEGITFLLRFFFIFNENYILAFNRARGHSMEKYTDDLLKRTSLSYVNEEKIQ
jgi:hypothetical protein